MTLKVKRQSTDWEKIFVMSVTDKGLEKQNVYIFKACLSIRMTKQTDG